MKLLESQKAQIEKAINDLFYGLKVRMLGRFFTGPRIYFELIGAQNPLDSLEGIYNYTYTMLYGPGAKPTAKRAKELSKITGNYIEAERLKTINKIMVGIDKADSFEEVKEEIDKHVEKATNYVKTLVTTEVRQVQANAEREGIEKLGASIGVQDPTVCKLGVIDDKLCPTCVSLWHSDDNIQIPKVYKMSELKDGYNENKKKPIPTIAPSHPHCFDKETEVLTNRGWIKFNSVEKNDVFLSVDLNTGNADWVKHIGLLKYRYNGKMLSIKNNRTDILTTPNHKHVLRRRSHKKECSLLLTEFEYAKTHSDSIVSTIPEWQGVNINPVFDGKEYNIKDFSEFLGYYLSEGCVTYGSKNTVRVEVCQDKYPEVMIKSFEKIFNKTPYYKHMKIIQYIKRNSELHLFLEGLGKSHEKFIPNLIKNSKKEIISVFLGAFRLGDGSYRKRNQKGFGSTEEILYHTSSAQLSADIGELILKIGKKPVYSYAKPKKVEHKNGLYTAKQELITTDLNQSLTLLFQSVGALAKEKKTAIVLFIDELQDLLPVLFTAV